MCGILFELSQIDGTNASSSVSEELIKDVSHRGPDSLKTAEFMVGSLRLRFTASVLSLRGTNVVSQPLFSSPSDQNNTTNDGKSPEYLLCWNGEAWRYDGREFGPHENDTQLIFDHLTACKGNVGSVLQKIEGPFAFVFYDGPKNRLWFGRDWLGRRSLLLRKYSGDIQGLAICSIADRLNVSSWDEVEADGFYSFELPQEFEGLGMGSSWQPVIEGMKFAFDSEHETSNGMSMRPPVPQLCKQIPESDTPALTPNSLAVTQLYELLRESLRLRVQNVPLHSVPRVPGHQGDLRPAKIGILFSGGLDCTMLARIAHDILPIQEPIELLNVAFENKRSLDAAIAEGKKTKKTKTATSNGQELQDTIHTDTSSFVMSGQLVDDKIYGVCPDRQTGRKSYKELQAVCEDRDWRFKEINVPYETVLEHKSKVMALLHPHDTEMDLSIGLAFYFASRPLEPNSPRILLSGLGADELFGGYARHGTAFNRAGFPALIEELSLDLNRLGKRNLGRDDRIIANWGREARFPFLDERLLKDVISWPVNEKCGFGALSNEEEWDSLDNEKKVLRLLAWRLGMKGVATEKKRAIQFGARTAKMEASKGGKVKGTQKIRVD